MLTSQRAHEVNFGSIPIRTSLISILPMYMLCQIRKKFGLWAVRNLVIQHSLRLDGTFLQLTISLLFLLDEVSLTGIIMIPSLRNMMKNMLSLCLIGEQLLSNSRDSSDSEN